MLLHVDINDDDDVTTQMSEGEFMSKPKILPAVGIARASMPNLLWLATPSIGQVEAEHIMSMMSQLEHPQNES